MVNLTTNFNKLSIVVTGALIFLFFVRVQALPFVHKSNGGQLRPSKLIKIPEYEQPINLDELDISNETASNEATPGFFEKKLEKILTKLQYLATLSNREHELDFEGNKTVVERSEVENGTKLEKIQSKSENIQIVDKVPEQPSILSQIVTPVVSLAYRIFTATHPPNSTNN